MQKHSTRWVVGLIVAFVPLAACQHETHAEHEHPSQVESVEGSELSRVTLTEKAIERIDLKTTSVSEREAAGSPQRVVPYSSLLYDPHGGTWIYTSPKPRSYIRAPVVVDRIEGDEVFLSDGPPVGTVVVSVGVAELYGTEFKVGH